MFQLGLKRLKNQKSNWQHPLDHRKSKRVSEKHGNGHLLQCSCLENPRDGGPWWAAVYGVAQSRTRLKRLRSSSSSGKESACQCRRHKRCGFSPWVGKIPWWRAWQLTPVFLPGESQGQSSLPVTVHSVSKSQSPMKRPSMHAHEESLNVCNTGGQWSGGLSL